MSRWWPEPLTVGLAPGEVALAGAGDIRTLSTATRAADSLLPLLDQLLVDAGARRRRVDVVLSQHFVRHVITPPPGKALSHDEEEALVAASLHDIYGSETAGWRMTVHSQPPHAGLVGAAVDGEWLEQIEACLARHGARQTRIVPASSVAVRRLPARFDGWWLGIEPGWATLMGAAKGLWQHEAAMPIDDDWLEAVADWLVREAESSKLAIAPRIALQPMGVAASGPLDIAGWQCLQMKHDTQSRVAAALTAA